MSRTQSGRRPAYPGRRRPGRWIVLVIVIVIVVAATVIAKRFGVAAKDLAHVIYAVAALAGVLGIAGAVQHRRFRTG